MQGVCIPVLNLTLHFDLGFFKVGRKKELKTKIEAIQVKINGLNASLTKISEQYGRDIKSVADSAEAQKSSYPKELDKKYKLPPNPANKNDGYFDS